MKRIFVLLLLLTSSQFSQWIRQTTPAEVNALLCIDFYDQNYGVAGGWQFTDDYIGKAIYTTNSGNNWIVSGLPDSVRSVVRIQMLTQTTGYLAGLYNTNINNDPDQQRKPSRISRYPDFTEKYSGSFGLEYDFKGMFLKTSNSGQSWFKVGNLPSNIKNVVGMKFVNSSTGFITAVLDNYSGNKYGILKSTNGGLLWTSLIIEDSVQLSDIFTSDGFNIYVGGVHFTSGSPKGIILRSSNSGVNWVSQNVSNTIQIIDLSFSNSTTGFAIGVSSGIHYSVLKTTNSGNTWSTASTLPVNTDLKSIEFVNGTGKGMATGADNVTSFTRSLIYRTTNFGSNWTTYTIPDTNFFCDQSLIDQNIWFVCGGIVDPSIYKSLHGGEIGIHSIGGPVPASFSLSQNYPNPFNPATKIKFDISGTSAAQTLLSVYDILGNEVAVLVNQQLRPGTYEVSWDASVYPSGVYYYRLEASDPSTSLRVTETEKMVLIK